MKHRIRNNIGTDEQELFQSELSIFFNHPMVKFLLKAIITYIAFAIICPIVHLVILSYIQPPWSIVLSFISFGIIFVIILYVFDKKKIFINKDNIKQILSAELKSALFLLIFKVILTKLSIFAKLNLLINQIIY